jgi:hypothetical protein
VDCERHPFAAAQGSYCAACLLEEALRTSIESQEPERVRITILLPLGESATASTLLVRMHGDIARLARLKIWRSQAPSDFLSQFHELRARLNEWSGRPIDVPISAFVDAAGCPSVLTEFRQGIPILDAVKSGALPHDDALTRLAALTVLTRRAHARGLVHGSVVAGNVIVQRGSPAAWLLDFGLALLLMNPDEELPSASEDVAAFGELSRAVRDIPAAMDHLVTP